MFEPFGVVVVVAEIEVLDLGGKARGKFVASKCVIVPMPLRASHSEFHIASTVLPTGVTQPMPVTTTRRLIGSYLTQSELG